MRTAVPIVLFALLAALAAWLAFGEQGVEPPPGTPDASGRQEGRTAEVPRTERSDGTPTRPEPRPAPDPGAGKPNEGVRDATPANVLLLVGDDVGRGPLAEFSWSYRSEGRVARGEGTAGRAELHLGPGSKGQLLVEAAGMSPVLRDLMAPGPAEGPTTIELFLTAAAHATGITLLVHDPAMQPIPHVRVDAFALAPESRASNAWLLGEPMWARRTSAADGRYVLPELQPGEYGIRVVAIAETGELLPMLPFTRRFELTGSNGFVEDVTLEVGCLPKYELVDAAGNALDPAKVGTVALSLALVGAPPVSRKWTVTTGTVAAAAVDVLPGVGPVVPAEALPAGSYELKVAIAGHATVQQVVVLRPGDTAAERVVVP